MKMIFVVLAAFLLAGCASSQRNASLTAEEARTVAVKLANDKAYSLYHCRPFHDGQSARFVAGHWRWAELQGFGHSDFQATVELAADGSTNKVNLELFNNQNPLPVTRF